MERTSSLTPVLDVAAPGLTFLLLVGFSPLLAAPFFSLRSVILLVLGALALAAFIERMRGGWDATLLLGVAFLLWATASTLRQPDVHAVLGLWNAGTGLVFLFVIVSLTFLGMQLTEVGRVRLLLAALAGVAVNAVVGMLLMKFDLEMYRLAPDGGRSPGLLGNPIHLGSVCGAAVALTALAARRSLPAALVGAAILGGGVQVSGSRIGIVLALPAVAYVVRQAGLRRGLLLGAALVAGGVVLPLLADGGRGAATVTATDRIDAAGGSYVGRIETWRTALHAVADEPLFGAGPAHFLDATSRYRTVSLARAETPERLFGDAHNLVVEHLVTVGVPGALLLMAFLVALIRGGRSDGLVFGILLLVAGLVQPMHHATTPVAFLALGVASRGSPVRWVAARGVAAVAALAAIVVGAVFLQGAFLLREAELDFRAEQSRRAEALLPDWWATADQQARIALFTYIDSKDPRDLDESLRQRRIATRRDPGHPRHWNDLAELELVAGRAAAAEDDFRRALERDPVSVRALLGLSRSLLAQQRPREVPRLLDRAALLTDDAAVENLRRDAASQR